MIRPLLVVAALLSATAALAADPPPAAPTAADDADDAAAGDTNNDGSDADELAVRKAIAEVEAERALHEARAAEERAQPAAAAPAAPPIDVRELPPPSSGLVDLIGPLIKTMLMLAVVVALAYLTLQKGLGKLVERQNLGKRVKVVERVALDSKRSLYLVDVDGKQMLLGAGDGGVVLIRDVDARAAASPAAAPARFADALGKRAGAAGTTSATAPTSAATTTTDEKASA